MTQKSDFSGYAVAPSVPIGNSYAVPPSGGYALGGGGGGGSGYASGPAASSYAGAPPPPVENYLINKNVRECMCVSITTYPMKLYHNILAKLPVMLSNANIFLTT